MGAGIYAGAPLREVVHIEERTGERGALLWRLTLSCGHGAFRPRRPLKPDNILEPLERKLAPRHARCLFCTVNDESQPER